MRGERGWNKAYRELPLDAQRLPLEFLAREVREDVRDVARDVGCVRPCVLRLAVTEDRRLAVLQVPSELPVHQHIKSALSLSFTHTLKEKRNERKK